MQITSETINFIFVATQTIVIIGGIIFSVRKWMTEPLKQENLQTRAELKELEERTNRRYEETKQEIEKLQKKVHQIEVELPQSYLHKEWFLALHNKLEADLKQSFNDLKQDLKQDIANLRKDFQALQRFLMEGKHERRTN
jgi:uncharacterized protein YpuA (DUF1002 family)